MSRHGRSPGRHVPGRERIPAGRVVPLGNAAQNHAASMAQQAAVVGSTLSTQVGNLRLLAGIQRSALVGARMDAQPDAADIRLRELRVAALDSAAETLARDAKAAAVACAHWRARCLPVGLAGQKLAQAVGDLAAIRGVLHEGDPAAAAILAWLVEASATLADDMPAMLAAADDAVAAVTEDLDPASAAVAMPKEPAP